MNSLDEEAVKHLDKQLIATIKIFDALCKHKSVEHLNQSPLSQQFIPP